MCTMSVNFVRKKVVKKFCNEFWKETPSVSSVKLLSFTGTPLWNNASTFLGMLAVNVEIQPLHLINSCSWVYNI